MYTPTPEEWGLIRRALGEYARQQMRGEFDPDEEELADVAWREAEVALALEARIAAAGCAP